MTENDYEYADSQHGAPGVELFFVTIGLLIIWGATWLA